MSIYDHKRTRATGFTLVELLVVVGMIVVLLAVSIPTLKLAMKDSKKREASRMLSSFAVVAQGRAAESGRPIGLWIERDENNADHSIAVYMAEVPAPYTGDVLGAGAVFNATPGTDGAWGVINVDDDGINGVDDPGEAGMGDDVIGPDNGPDGQPGQQSIDDDGINGIDDVGELGWVGSDDNFITLSATGWNSSNTSFKYLVGRGDRIRFKHQGALFAIVETEPFPTSPLQVHIEHETVPIVSYPTGAVPYEVVRRPQRSNIQSIELPKGIVIDLAESGMGANGREFRVDSDDDGVVESNPSEDKINGPIIILFDVSGRIDRVYYQSSLTSGMPPPAPVFNVVRPTGPVHLLIGHDDENQDSKPDNLENETSLWISIGNTTGSVTSSENVGVVGGTTTQARFLARQAQIMQGS